MSTAISVRDVSKRFRISQEKYDSLKERVIHFGRSRSEDFWALRAINLEIQTGTTVGLLGHNGSGKSTLLKCIAGILQPTTGEIGTVGRMAALLELGAGMNPELTGRENVYMNGAILGMSKRELARRFDEIVDFSELEQFIDTQVKYYSSGMYVRLGFAVAVNVDPEVLLVDEVLAVGDEAFQGKCLERVKQFQRDGRTIVVVSHAADLIRRVCDQVAVLDHGELVFDGLPGEAVRTFREHLLKGESYELPSPDAVLVHKPIEFTYVLVERDVLDRTYLLPGETLVVRAGFDAMEPLDNVMFTLVVYDANGQMMHQTNSDILAGPLSLDGTGEVVFTLDDVPLLDGSFTMTLGASSVDGGTVYDWREQQYRFEVMNPGREQGIVAMPVRMEISQNTPPREAAR